MGNHVEVEHPAGINLTLPDQGPEGRLQGFQSGLKLRVGDVGQSTGVVLSWANTRKVSSSGKRVRISCSVGTAKLGGGILSGSVKGICAPRGSSTFPSRTYWARTQSS